MGSKSGNFSEYEEKRWQHRFVGFIEKSENLACICEKCKLMAAFLAEERFDSAFLAYRYRKKIHFVEIFYFN